MKTKTAAAAYAARQAEIAALIDALQAKLADHAQRASADAGNWGFAGDLAGVSETLRDALDRI